MFGCGKELCNQIKLSGWNPDKLRAVSVLCRPLAIVCMLVIQNFSMACQCCMTNLLTNNDIVTHLYVSSLLAGDCCFLQIHLFSLGIVLCATSAWAFFTAVRYRFISKLMSEMLESDNHLAQRRARPSIKVFFLQPVFDASIFSALEIITHVFEE